MNGALFDPQAQDLFIHARRQDISMHEEEGLVIVRVEHLDEGIEIPNPHERLWRPA